MTQEQCESAVKALQQHGFSASHVQCCHLEKGAPDDHGVWLNGVWADALADACSFRIHDEEIEWWENQTKDK